MVSNQNRQIYDVSQLYSSNISCRKSFVKLFFCLHVSTSHHYMCVSPLEKLSHASIAPFVWRKTSFLCVLQPRADQCLTSYSLSCVCVFLLFCLLQKLYTSSVRLDFCAKVYFSSPVFSCFCVFLPYLLCLCVSCRCVPCVTCSPFLMVTGM